MFVRIFLYREDTFFMKHFIRQAFIFILTVACLCACSDTPKKTAGENKLTVVTTVFPLYDFARELCGEKGEAIMLLPAGAEAHSYEPTVQDIIKINESSIFINIGGSADPWASAIAGSNTKKDINTLSVSESLNLISEGHESSTFDEHVWSSPKNALLIVSAICDELCRISPENEAYFRENEKKLTEKLNSLDASFSEAVASSKLKTIVFADRFPFRYLARDYSLDYFAAFPGCSSESEPSAQTVAKLIEKIKEDEIPAVFYTETSNQKMADTICEETKVKKLLMHSCHSVTKKQLAENITYEKLMLENLAALKEALN